MKILHLSQYEGGGAGRATRRLHVGLINTGINSAILVQGKDSDLESIAKPVKEIEMYKNFQSDITDGVLKKFFGRKTPLSINLTPSLMLKQIKNINPDIIHLHWIGREFLKIEELPRLNQPLVWTLHDMWPFTGGCHYNGECDRYTHSCGACPQLRNSQESDLTRWVWQRKAKAWKHLNLTLICPSKWMMECAQASSLFQNLRIEVIPNGLDIKRYRPLNQQTARELLSLPQDKQVILFGALSAKQDIRKGYQFLLPALQKLAEAGWTERLELVVFGSSQRDRSIELLGFQTNFLGRLDDDLSLAIVYSAADVMIVPSLQESFGQTASESLACGTPVVAFDATGLKDIVDHRQNGYLAEPYAVEDLLRGILWVLEDKERYQQLRNFARKKAETAFSVEMQTQRYLSIYREIAPKPHG